MVNTSNETDARGVPVRHMDAEDMAMHGPDYKGPALARYHAADYTSLPLMPEAVQAARKKMDEAARLVGELDEAAFDLLDEYRTAPREANRKALDAVAAGKTPESTAKLDKRLDELARKYRDAVGHRKAVESYLIRLVDAYHAEAEVHLPAWRDAIAAELDERAEPTRVALAAALSEARAVYGLASAVESMDRPRHGPDERPRPSALAGRELPEAFRIDATRGQGGVNYAPDTANVGAALDAAGTLASHWLRVDGRAQLGSGPIPEALTVPVSDLPPEDVERKRAETERTANEKRAREYLTGRGVVGLA
ncbi:hypothetical protein ACFXKD_27435 [Nocardiopsis aegyptia]|uniref:hypothetical protein n=1 Tax=Nocardiopsis aegyptia TaxID=220378 RepID=UPI0036724B5B